MENRETRSLKVVEDYLERQRFTPKLNSPSNSDLGLIVVIPAHREVELERSLEAINSCMAPKSGVEVIVVINQSKTADQDTRKFHQNQYDVLTESFKDRNYPFQFILELDMPKKHAGVGLARKIGMDEAASRFVKCGNPNGVIICFDADSLCDFNYLVEIDLAFRSNQKAVGASIRFEHPYDSPNEAIALYESHLRYYRQALRWAGHPYAHHTIGSSMAVRCDTYASQNGMNKRKAGEDFYFLQKVIPQGDFLEINSTRVIPSPRPSDRVPFGTGRAILEYHEGRELNKTYPFSAFQDIKRFLEIIDNGVEKGFDFSALEEELNSPLLEFLTDQGFFERLPDMLEYGTRRETFLKRFFNWFNLFRAMKYIHFAREAEYEEMELKEAVSALFQKLGRHKGADNDLEALKLLDYEIKKDAL